MTEWGPVISAIDAGHVEHGNKCVECSGGKLAIEDGLGIDFPCPDILAARRDQKDYARYLIQQRDLVGGRLDLRNP